ncbi:transposase family protein [Peribacillus loiseleuriae]|uniref:transposase family protein n=1 Tax=Peribacillus loiseleuriae TaxID=1679170 RepID=UPI003CFE2F86
MLVSKIIHKIMVKEMTIKELAELYGVSDRTIQLKIKKLGYEWDSKKSVYNYLGEFPEPSDVDFSTLFGKNNASMGEINKSKSKFASTSNDEMDSIDMLLAGKKTHSKRVYRGFYFDEDILNIIDRVPRNYKSELVNESLRKIFKDKGLLE